MARGPRGIHWNTDDPHRRRDRLLAVGILALWFALAAGLYWVGLQDGRAMPAEACP